MRVVGDVAGAGPDATIGILFHDRFGSLDDYLAAVEEVHGYGARRACQEALESARDGLNMFAPIDNDRAAEALLGVMPEHDFMQAVEETLIAQRRAEQASDRINRILNARGAPYSFDGINGFGWTGDTEIEREQVAPALAAINDVRFAGGVRNEFEQARRELRQGTPNGRKQAVHEAGCAVESAMKVVLHERGVPFAATDSGQRLFDHLERAGIVPRYMQPTMFSVLTPRNKRAGHGGGSAIVDPGETEASTVVASAAGAIAYLYGKL
jgi:hypothetical protein